MKLIFKPSEMQDISESLRLEGKKIAVVPTMGFLHEGHVSLILKAKELADIVITTLFVNPTQFAPNEDFGKYPRSPEKDFNLAESKGCDYLFYPTSEDMYPGGFNRTVVLSGVTEKFEGLTRPTHFNGVATVVAKLFNIIRPHIAVFGQKDYQQTLIIKQVVNALFFDIKIVMAPTVREADGLALSSRNVYLSAEERGKAGIIYKALSDALQAMENGENRRKIINAILHNRLRTVAEIKIDYASAADADTLEEPDVFLPGEHVILLIAVYVGKTRLIDNALISVPNDTHIKKHYFV
jgi:pantoate--beta-alanine ligase